jgi:hypothetical protein
MTTHVSGYKLRNLICIFVIYKWETRYSQYVMFLIPWVWNGWQTYGKTIYLFTLDESYILRYNFVYSVDSQQNFWSNTEFLLSGSKKQADLITCFMLVSCLTHSPILKTEATCLSETSVDFQRTSRHYAIKDITIHKHLFENLKSYCSLFISLTFIFLNSSAFRIWAPFSVIRTPRWKTQMLLPYSVKVKLSPCLSN